MLRKSRSEATVSGRAASLQGRHDGRPPHVVIIVQNMPVPLDRRVWLECQSLIRGGYAVSVICPKGPGDPSYERLEGVELHKYNAPPEAHGVLGFVVEFAVCWLRTAVRLIRIFRRHRVDVIQTCNPPDTYFLLALPFKLVGTRFVFDQHDLCPEMFYSRFGKQSGPLVAGLRGLERATYALADRVITTNESYARIALTRGRKQPSEVTVVRSGPDSERWRPRPAVPSLKRGRRYMACWLGIMGPQDGVRSALRAAHNYVYELHRDDCHFAFLGFGDDLPAARRLCHELHLEDWVTFTGRADLEMIADYLSTASVGLVPDEKTPYADLSTHNKTLEYMAFALPVVTFDLKETRISAGGSAHVVPAGDIPAFASAIADLLDSEERRRAMGQEGRAKIVQQLGWSHQAPRYVGVYDELLGGEAFVSQADPLSGIGAG